MMKTGFKQYPYGMTLVETLTAMASVSILVIGLMSCMLIAGKLIDPQQTTAAQQTQANNALDRFARDMQHATRFLNRSATGVTVEVPDRDGDDQPEIMSYSWSGTSGDPLLLSINGGTAREVSPSLQTISFSYDEQTVTGTGFEKGVSTAASNQFLVSNEVDLGNTRESYINARDAFAFWVKPDLPVTTTNWTLTLLRMQIRSALADDGKFKIQVRSGSQGNGPSETILYTEHINEADLSPTFAWHDFPLNATINTPAGDGIYIVLIYESGKASVAGFTWEENGPQLPETELYFGNQQVDWSLLDGEMEFYLYGTVPE